MKRSAFLARLSCTANSHANHAAINLREIVRRQEGFLLRLFKAEHLSADDHDASFRPGCQPDDRLPDVSSPGDV